jgi:hypothetical protein
MTTGARRESVTSPIHGSQSVVIIGGMTPSQDAPDAREDYMRGRMLDDDAEAIAVLSAAELERELTIAALSRHRRRRFDALLAERKRRRAGRPAHAPSPG